MKRKKKEAHARRIEKRKLKKIGEEQRRDIVDGEVKVLCELLVCDGPGVHHFLDIRVEVLLIRVLLHLSGKK